MLIFQKGGVLAKIQRLKRNMRILRYEDPSGKIHYASQQQGDSYVRIEGDPYDGFQVTKEPAKVQRILAPVVPTMIWCIGQNYRRTPMKSEWASRNIRLSLPRAPTQPSIPASRFASR